jgi:CheY-like chemotaxis protein
MLLCREAMKDLKILIVDDDPFNLIVLEGLLKQFKI